MFTLFALANLIISVDGIWRAIANRFDSSLEVLSEVKVFDCIPKACHL